MNITVMNIEGYNVEIDEAPSGAFRARIKCSVSGCKTYLKYAYGVGPEGTQNVRILSSLPRSDKLKFLTMDVDSWICERHSLEVSPICYVLFGQSNANATFAEQITLKTGVPVYRENFPGESIINWYNGSVQENLTANIAFLKAIKTHYINKIIWFQGEADTNSQALVDSYYDRTIKTFARLLWNASEQTEIYIMNISGEFTDEDKIARVNEVRGLQQDIANNYRRVTIFDTEGLERQDVLHLSEKGFSDLCNIIW